MNKMWKNAAKNLNHSYLYGKKNISTVESYNKENKFIKTKTGTLKFVNTVNK